MILLCGIGGTLIGLSGYLIPAIRNVDDYLPDYTPLPPPGIVLRIRPRTEKRSARNTANKRRIKKALTKSTKDKENEVIKLEPKE